MSSEKQTQSEILESVNKKPHCRVFRNNIGFGYTGQKTGEHQDEHGNTYTIIKNARPIKFGLQAGSGDLIGWKQITIVPEMVGSKIAAFLSCEVKTSTGRISEDQKNWIVQVTKSGGIAFIARGVEDVENL